MDSANKPDQQMVAMAIPLTCTNDGAVLYAGVKTITAGGNTYNYNAWLCPTEGCTYWKIRTVTPS